MHTHTLTLTLSLFSFPSFHSLLSLSHQLEVPHALYLATEYNISRGSCGKYVHSIRHTLVVHVYNICSCTPLVVYNQGYLCADPVVSCCDRLVFQDYFSNSGDIMIKKQQQNQARDVFCRAFASNWRSFMACKCGHTHLIVFTHACGYYLRAATIFLAELQVRLLFEGSYYSGCGFYSNKYGISKCASIAAKSIPLDLQFIFSPRNLW